jgi:enoyl-CoA hydratase
MMLSTEVAAGVAVVTLDDPARRNALSPAMVTEIQATFDALEADAAVAAVIVTGAAPAFCAGADLSERSERGGKHSATANKAAEPPGEVTTMSGLLSATGGVEAVYEGFLRVARSPLPTVAAVNGPAVGAGLNLALACDVRIAAESAWFETRFLKIGLHPGGGNTWMLNRLLGPQGTAAMVLFGERVRGAEAAAIGLAHRCVPDADLLAQARALAAGAAGVDPELLRHTKATIRRTRDGRGFAEALAEETREQMWSLTLPSTRARLEAAARPKARNDG